MGGLAGRKSESRHLIRLSEHRTSASQGHAILARPRTRDILRGARGGAGPPLPFLGRRDLLFDADEAVGGDGDRIDAGVGQEFGEGGIVARGLAAEADL